MPDSSNGKLLLELPDKVNELGQAMVQEQLHPRAPRGRCTESDRLALQDALIEAGVLTREQLESARRTGGT